MTCVSERCQDSDVVWVRTPEYDAAAAAEEVIGEASPTPPGRWRLGRIVRWALAGAAVIATVSVAAVRDVGAPAPGPGAAGPVGAPAAVVEGHYAVPVGAHHVVAMAATDAAIYTLTAEPAQLTRQDGTRAPARVTAPLGATDLLVDRSTSRLWVFAAADRDGATASSYDLDTLTQLSVVRLPSQVNSAAVLGDAIWLGTDGGVYVLRRGATAAALVSHAWPDVVSVVAEPARNRLLAVTVAMPAQLLSITPSGTILEYRPAPHRPIIARDRGWCSVGRRIRPGPACVPRRPGCLECGSATPGRPRRGRRRHHLTRTARRVGQLCRRSVLPRRSDRGDARSLAGPEWPDRGAPRDPVLHGHVRPRAARHSPWLPGLKGHM